LDLPQLGRTRPHQAHPAAPRRPWRLPVRRRRGRRARRRARRRSRTAAPRTARSEGGVVTLMNADTSEIVRPDALLPARGELSPVALVLPDDLSFDEWQGYGRRLRLMEQSVMWWLGDWWLHGERRYGEAASQAAPTGYDSETLRKAAWVCERVETVRRRTD